MLKIYAAMIMLFVIMSAVFEIIRLNNDIAGHDSTTARATGLFVFGFVGNRPQAHTGRIERANRRRRTNANCTLVFAQKNA